MNAAKMKTLNINTGNSITKTATTTNMAIVKAQQVIIEQQRQEKPKQNDIETQAPAHPTKTMEMAISMHATSLNCIDRQQKCSSPLSKPLLTQMSKTLPGLQHDARTRTLPVTVPVPVRVPVAVTEPAPMSATGSHTRASYRYYRLPDQIVKAAVAYLIVTALCALPRVNGLPNCPIGCSCDDDTLVVKCIEGTLDVVPITLNPSIQRLVITNNKKIRTIDSSIYFYYDLTFLDLSHNELVNIPEGTFKMQIKLRELNLSHNKIGQIESKTFLGLNSLTVLNLRGNLIAELERATFLTTSKIEELNLGANRISSIDPHAFDGLVNLRVLYLDDNTLTTVPAAGTFTTMPSLAELFLGTNSFETLPAGVFQSIKGLTRLDLRSAGLTYNISAEALKGLEGLRSLDLSDNRLQYVPTNALSHLQRLEELSIGQNDFEVIAPGAFEGLKNLIRLEVTGAQRLVRIANGAFADNTNLEYLNFSGNKILSTIEENVLRGLPHLRHVILRENQLSTLAEGLFPWTDLITLDLVDNPFVCDCHVLWLRNLLVSKNESRSSGTKIGAGENGENGGTGNIESVICDAPERFHGQSLAQLSPTVLGCSSGSSDSQALICVIIVGVTIVLSVLFFIFYGCRRRIRETLKGGWGNSALGRKEREYQKTFSDEENMTRQQHPCLGLGVYPAIPTTPYASDTFAGNYNTHNSVYMGSRSIPVTEL